MKNPPAALAVETLDLESLKRGEVTRLKIGLTQNALGEPLNVPVMVARGLQDGPVFGITAAVHGDEINGIPVIQKLMRQINTKTLRGTVVAVLVVNVTSYVELRRRFREGVDLNHIMPGKFNGSVPQVFAHRLMDRIIQRFDYLADLHTASPGRINSLYVRADMTDPAAARMAYLQRPQIIVHNPPVDVTLRGAASALGIPSITVEIGNPGVFQNELIRRSVTGIRAVLAELDMIPKRTLALNEEPVVCARSGWLFSDGGGMLEVFPKVTQYVEEGEEIARAMNIFGDVTRTYLAPHAGVVIGKSVSPVGQTGARILHLGEVAEPGTLLARHETLNPSMRAEDSR